jgi:NADH-quinone oxidoreductase subunit G
VLSKDFLHKARVWDLDNNTSICPNCSQGCNIRIDTRDNLVMRLRPRPNPDVNSYWMCDYGRHRYEWLNAQPRLDTPLQRAPDGRLLPMSWQQAVLAIVERLQRVADQRVVVVGSALLGNEDNGMLARLGDALGADEPRFRSARAEDEVVCPGFPRLARRRDLAANVRGLEALGFRRVGDDAGAGGLAGEARSAGGPAVMIVLGDALDDVPADFGADAELFIVLGHALAPAAQNADFVLPVTTFAEQPGTFTNYEGRVQRFWPALQPPPHARPGWQVLAVLLAGLDGGSVPADAASAFLHLAEHYEAFAGLSYDTIGARGALINDAVRLGAGMVERT